MKQKLVAAAIICFFNSSNAVAVDLIGIYRDALAQDPAFAAARFENVAAQERLPQAQAANKWSAGLAAGINFADSQRSGLSTSSTTTPSYTLSLLQPLYNPVNDRNISQSELSITSANAKLADARQDLMVRVSQAYFDVLLAQDNTALSAAQKQAFSEQLAQAKRNFEVGTSTIVDTYEAQARFDLAVAREIADQNDLEIKRRALQSIIGKLPDNLSILQPDVKLTQPLPANMEAWVKTAEDGNFTVAQLRTTFAIAAQEVEKQKLGESATVNASASLGGSYAAKSSLPPGAGRWGNSVGVGVNLNMPLYTGGGMQSRVREALANKDRTEQDLERARRSAAQGARQSYLGVTNGIAQVNALQAALTSNKASLDSTLLGKEVGVRTNVDVLNAQQQLFQARRDLQAARYTTVMSQLRLKSAVGSLKEEDLAEVNRMLVAK